MREGIALGFLFDFLQRVFTLNGTFQWALIGQYLFYYQILQGLLLTVIISVIAQVLGSVIGLLLYFVRRSSNPLVRKVGEAYVLFFRGTPLIVQILIFYNFLPYVGLARPLINSHAFAFLGFAPEVPVDSFVAACLALALNEGAYMAEIVRAGIDAVDVGQMEAAKSLGMTYRLAMRRIVLPQAMRVIIPPLGNEFNNMLKSSSLAFAISLRELLGTATSIASSLFVPLEMYLVISIWYLVLTTLWGFVQSWLERRFNASSLDPALAERQAWWQRAFGVSRGAPPVPGAVAPPSDTGAH